MSEGGACNEGGFSDGGPPPAPLAGRFGAMPETVVEGQTGWLVESEAAAVADRLAAVLADRGAAGRMGAAGRARVAAHYTSDRRAAAVEAVYARVLAPG